LDESAIYFAKRFGKTFGYSGVPGGWIYDRTGKPVAQGWLSFYTVFSTSITMWINKNLRKHGKSQKEINDMDLTEKRNLLKHRRMTRS